MKNMLVSWKENRDTFGGGKAWTRAQVIIYYGFLLVLSLLLAVVSDRPSDEFFNATLTALSIIAGFTFNALIFFVDHKFTIQKDPDSIEQRARQERLNQLADNSFKIIYYFNLVALTSVVLCIIALVMPSVGADAPEELTKYFDLTEVVGRAVFFAVLGEAIVTFLRALRRLRYLFGKVREAQ